MEACSQLTVCGTDTSASCSSLCSSTIQMSTSVERSSVVVIAVVAVLALTAVVRVVDLGSEPFWLDEIISHDHTSGTIPELFSTLLRDIHPPLYEVGLWGWRQLAGSSPVALRSYSVFWSTLGVIVLMGLSRELTGRWATAVVAGMLGALAPLLVYFAQESRMYAQAATLTTLSTWLLVRWLQSEARSRRWTLIAYTAAAASCLLTHYVCVTVLVAQGLITLPFLVRQRRWNDACGYMAAGGGAAVACLPWLWYVLSSRGELYLHSMAGWMSAPTAADLVRLLIRYIPFGHSPVHAYVGVGATVVAIGLWGLAAIGAASRARTQRSVSGALVAWMAVVPVALAVLVSWVMWPVLYAPRFAVLVVPPFLALLAVAAEQVRWRRAAVLTVCALLAGATLGQQIAPQKPGLAEFAALWRRLGPPDQVLFYPRWNRRVAGYYLGEPVWNVPSPATFESDVRRDTPVTLWLVTRVGDDLSGEPQPHRSMVEKIRQRGLPSWSCRVDDVVVQELIIDPDPKRFPAYRVGTRIEPGAPDAEHYLWSGWYPSEQTFRWSRKTRSEIVVALDRIDQPLQLVLRMFCFHRQRITVLCNGSAISELVCSERSPHTRTFTVPAELLRRETSIVFELPDAVAPAEVSKSADTRRLALGIEWLALQPVDQEP